MSEQSNETAEPESADSSSGESFEGSDDPTTVSDDQLPEDLRPTDDNPLAKPEGEEGDSDGGINVQEQAGEAAGGPPG